MILVAILLPWLSFLLRGRIIQGIICFVLQITLIGWLPATIWAIVSLNNSKADERNKKLIKAIKQQQEKM